MSVCESVSDRSMKLGGTSCWGQGTLVACTPYRSFGLRVAFPLLACAPKAGRYRAGKGRCRSDEHKSSMTTKAETPMRGVSIPAHLTQQRPPPPQNK
ncbi:hypothetical protein BaRGS_00008944 [Batillaria attramentaria]|uniref:Uncharacterized protein n=1 Tax=Batillaria attramentaria TaxID=370345 RepID=A0ABD0LKB9_9CAEN